MSIPITLSLEPMIQKVLDTRCIGLSTDRDTVAFPAPGLLRYESDTGLFVVFDGTEWKLLIDLQNDPYVQGLIQSVTVDLTHIHERLNHLDADVYQRLDHYSQSLNTMFQRVEQNEGDLNNLETDVYQRVEQNEGEINSFQNLIENTINQKINTIFGRLNALEESGFATRLDAIQAQLTQISDRLLLLETDNDPVAAVF